MYSVRIQILTTILTIPDTTETNTDIKFGKKKSEALTVLKFIEFVSEGNQIVK